MLTDQLTSLKVTMAIDELLAQEAALKEQKELRAAESDMRHHLNMMCDLSQGQLWDTIHFYTVPALLERLEREGWDENDDRTLFIEFEDNIDVVNNWVIEDYYEKGTVWTM